MTKLVLDGAGSVFRRSVIASAGLALVGLATSAAAQGVQLNQNLQLQLLQQAPQFQAVPSPAPAQPLPAQRTVEIQQGNGLRFLDAHEDASRDFAVVTRPFQNDISQEWAMVYVQPDVVRLMQTNTGRYLDAHEVGVMGFRAVTRPYQEDSTQLWRIQSYGSGYFTLQQVSSGRFLNNNNSEPNDFPVYTTATMYEGEQNATVWLIN